jgi:hypothetical protein
VKVALGKFARTGIEELLGADLAVGVQAALTHYTRRLGSNWKPVRPPHFDWVSLDGTDAFDLAVAPELEAELQREAREQQVPIEQILAHAVLVYLADLESVTFAGNTAVAGDPLAEVPAPLRSPAA